MEDNYLYIKSLIKGSENEDSSQNFSQSTVNNDKKYKKENLITDLLDSN